MDLGEGELENVIVILAGRTLPDVSELGIERLVDERMLDSFDEERVRQFFEAHDVPLDADPGWLATATGDIPGKLEDMVLGLKLAQRDRQDPFYG